MDKVELKNLLDQSHAALLKNDFMTAMGCYDKIIGIDPGNDDALHFLAFLQNIQGNHRSALDLVQKAIDRYGCNSTYYTTLANIYRHIGDYRLAIDAIAVACRLSPRDAVNLSNAAMILADEKRYDRAKEIYQSALELSPDCAFIHFNYALLLLKMGEYEEGWKEYDWRIPCHYNSPLPTYPEDLKGKKIQIYHEQGFGDFLMFARYFQPLKNLGADVYTYCTKEMERLFPSRCCSNPDYSFLTMSLPRLIKEIPNKPYIEVPKKNHSLDFKVGVAHAANKPFNNSVSVLEQDGQLSLIPHPSNLAYLSAMKRSLPHDFFDPMFSKDVKFYNLQIDTHHYGMPSLEGVNDFYDLAERVTEMDLIITIDTALAHLAGAMGKTVWLLLPYDCDWRWGIDQTETIWYPSMRIFRQKRRGDWDSVQDEVLKLFYNGSR